MATVYSVINATSLMETMNFESLTILSVLICLSWLAKISSIRTATKINLVKTIQAMAAKVCEEATGNSRARDVEAEE